jgi:hypothetical protein
MVPGAESRLPAKLFRHRTFCALRPGPYHHRYHHKLLMGGLGSVRAVGFDSGRGQDCNLAAVRISNRAGWRRASRRSHHDAASVGDAASLYHGSVSRKRSVKWLLPQDRG